MTAKLRIKAHHTSDGFASGRSEADIANAGQRVLSWVGRVSVDGGATWHPVGYRVSDFSGRSDFANIWYDRAALVAEAQNEAKRLTRVAA